MKEKELKAKLRVDMLILEIESALKFLTPSLSMQSMFYHS